MQFEYKCAYIEKPASHYSSSSSKTRRTEGPSHTITSGLSPGSENYSTQSLSPNLNGAGISGRTFVPSSEQPGLSDPVRAKFWTAYSAVAFPRLLATEFNADNAPRLHSFAWNVGIRQEEPEAEADVAALLTLEEARRLSDIYFRIVHPEIGFLDRAAYELKVEQRWNGTLEDRGYDCVICGVTALGSYFAGTTAHPSEPKLVHTMKVVLQSSSVVYYPSVAHIAAWILRSMYMRLTTRPNGAWLSTCALTHILESTGLYKDQAAAPFDSSPESAIDSAEIEYRRRLFWVGYSLNGIIACEYGRTKIELEVTCYKPQADDKVSTSFIAIGDCIRRKYIPNQREDKPAMLMSIIEDLLSLTIETDFHRILRAEMIFAIYRRLRLLQFRLSKDAGQRILAAGDAGLDSVVRLATKQLAWWNIISCPFQFLCVCLAMDSPDSFPCVRKSMAVLDDLSKRFDTHMVREAVQVANSLIRIARDRKANDVRSLESCMPQAISPQNGDSASSLPGLEDPMLWSWGDDTFAWDLLLPSDQIPVSSNI